MNCIHTTIVADKYTNFGEGVFDYWHFSDKYNVQICDGIYVNGKFEIKNRFIKEEMDFKHIDAMKHIYNDIEVYISQLQYFNNKRFAKVHLSFVCHGLDYKDMNSKVYYYNETDEDVQHMIKEEFFDFEL